MNAGGYLPHTLAEQHEFDLFVAEKAAEAKAKALRVLLKDTQQQHKDNLKDVDDCLLLEKVDDFYLHLTENPDGKHFIPEWQGYQPIGE